MNLYRAHVLVCGGTGCHASNSNEIHNRLELKIKELGLEREIKVVMTGPMPTGVAAMPTATLSGARQSAWVTTASNSSGRSNTARRSYPTLPEWEPETLSTIWRAGASRPRLQVEER